MPAAPTLPTDHQALIDRLVDAPQGVVVVTPNRRLARALELAVAERHVAAGSHSWPAPDVLPWDGWLVRLYEVASFAEGGEPLPELLSPALERLVWENIVSRDGAEATLVGPSVLAREAQSAWRLAQEWQVTPGSGREAFATEDTQSFTRWARAWEGESARRRWIEEARLPSIVPAMLERTGKQMPQLVVAYAFDLLKPAQREVLAACEAVGVSVAHVGPPAQAVTPRRVATASLREELELAAGWARTRLEAWRGGRMPRIAVVIPALAEQRELVRRIFSRVLAPSGEAGLFDLSLGRPLSDFPLVHAALTALDLVSGSIPFERASRLLRSPFLAGGESERGLRARLDLALREIVPPLVDFPLLARLVADLSQAGPARAKAPPCPALEHVFRAVSEIALPSRAAEPSEWASAYARALAAFGFPGERPRNSSEHQTLAKWNEALASLGALGVVSGRMTGEAARRHLRQACAETLFQPDAGEAPVQVLGLLESVGLDFDALWVCGLTDDAWPQSPRPHPFLPVFSQVQAGVPQASAEASLELDRRITRGWARAAREVVFSHAVADADRALAASPLLAEFDVADAGALKVATQPTRHDAVFDAGQSLDAFTHFEDESGPALANMSPRGGTRILADQAACPFRAFARHRLGAEGVESVEPGLGAAERGILLHALFANVWESLVDHASLVGKTPDELLAVVDKAAQRAVRRLKAEMPGRLEGRFEALERERLVRVALEWLQAEKGRVPFKVVQTEQRMALAAGPLTLKGQVDRVDRLDNGALAVIDYKSGHASVGGWLGERPDDPQLPLYAHSMKEPVGAVAFATLRAGKRRFEGLARQSGLIPQVGAVSSHKTASKYYASWDQLLQGWREAIDALAVAFADGDARVNPKRQGATCQRCDVGPICRVRERVALEDEDRGDDDGKSEEGEASMGEPS